MAFALRVELFPTTADRANLASKLLDDLLEPWAPVRELWGRTPAAATSGTVAMPPPVRRKEPTPS